MMQDLSHPLRRSLRALYLLLCFLFYAHAPAGAQTALNPNNGSVTGSLIPGTSDTVVYSYAVTADTDAKLTLTMSAGVAATVRFYDMDNATQITNSSANAQGSVNLYVGHLGPGTYFVRVTRDGGSGNFTLSSKLTPPSVANDTEPNDNATQAALPALPAQATGHLGYSRSSYGDQDNQDWYAFKAPQDGDAAFTLIVPATLAARIRFYDTDGSSQIASEQAANGSATLGIGHLNSGVTYFVVVTRDGGYGGYQLNTQFTGTGITNDNEPDDDHTTANVLAPNGAVTGHIGYSTSTYGNQDNQDWYAFTPTQDGDASFLLSIPDTLAAHIRFYDTDGASQITNFQAYFGVAIMTIGHLNVGATYYVVVTRDAGYGAYSINNTYLPAALTNDHEPDDDAGHANVFAVNSSVTGHIGYSRSSYNDLDNLDWYAFTASQDGDVKFSLAVSDSLNGYLRFYDSDGASQIAIAYADTGGVANLTIGHLAPGATYFVRVDRNAGYGSYTLSNTLTAAALTNDKEPNDSAAQALTQPALTAKTTGHIGYSRSSYNDQDNQDWYAYTAPQDGDATFTLSVANTLNAYLRFYDSDGASQVTLTYVDTGGTGAITVGHLAPGATYFVRVDRNAGYGSYTLTPSFAPAGLKNDAEPNDDPGHGLPFAVNSSVTGHIGYSRGSYNAQDNIDWYAYTVPQDGDVTFTLTVPNTLNAYLRFYDSDGASQITNTYVDTGGTGSFTIGHLAPGATYFVRVDRNGGYGSYTLSNTLDPQTAPNDVEFNDSAGAAVAINNLNSVVGHLGYSRNSYNAIDTQDWYKISLPANSSQDVNFTVSDGLNAFLRFYAPDGASQISNINVYNGSGVLTVFNNTNTAATYFLAVTWNGGYGSYGLNPQPTGTLSGAVALDSIDPNAPQQFVTFAFTPTNGGAPFTETVAIGQNGAYTVPGLPRNLYNVKIKGLKWLQHDAAGVDLRTSDATLNAFLPGGDADNNNIVDIADFGIMVGAYGSDAGDPTTAYDIRADFNCDGIVDIKDFGILVNNYGSAGDP